MLPARLLRARLSTSAIRSRRRRFLRRFASSPNGVVVVRLIQSLNSACRIVYLNEDLQPTAPNVNPIVLERLNSVRCSALRRAFTPFPAQSSHVVFGQGSLYTSTVPCLVLKGVGEAVSEMRGRKILVLNGSHDRETGNMTAVDFVQAVADGLNRCAWHSCKAVVLSSESLSRCRRADMAS